MKRKVVFVRGEERVLAVFIDKVDMGGFYPCSDGGEEHHCNFMYWSRQPVAAPTAYQELAAKLAASYDLEIMNEPTADILAVEAMKKNIVLVDGVRAHCQPLRHREFGEQFRLLMIGRHGTKGHNRVLHVTRINVAGRTTGLIP